MTTWNDDPEALWEALDALWQLRKPPAPRGRRFAGARGRAAAWLRAHTGRPGGRGTKQPAR